MVSIYVYEYKVMRNLENIYYKIINIDNLKINIKLKC